MLNKHQNKAVVESLLRTVNGIIDIYSKALIEFAIKSNRQEVNNLNKLGNYLSAFDLEINEVFRKKLQNFLPPFILISEESEPEILPKDYKGLPDIMVVLDPLDTSELAIRGLLGYTHIFVHNWKTSTPIISIVGDFFHKIRLYYAFRCSDCSDKARIQLTDGKEYQIRSSKQTELNESIITTFLMKPKERFNKIIQKRSFFRSLGRGNKVGIRRGRIGIAFGSMGLCQVAGGFTDGMFEVAKGFNIWDLFPGLYILKSSGGVITDLKGKEIPLEFKFNSLDSVKQLRNKKWKFIAAGNRTLLNRLIRVLQ